MPVIFQLNIEDTDIKSNSDVFYIQEYVKGINAHKLTLDEDIGQIKNLLSRNVIIIADIHGYTEELRKTSPKTAQYLDLRLEELYEIYKPKTIVT